MMRHEVRYPGYCKNCGEDVELKNASLGREQLDGGERLFYICPFCDEELEDEVVCIEK